MPACWRRPLRCCAQPTTAAVSLKGTDIVPLGKTGIKVTRLAQGTGYNGFNHSSAQTRQGKEAFDRLLKHSLDQGIRFLDMADLYGSHPLVKDVIKNLPRDKYVLLTKIWPRKEDWVTPSGGAKEELDRFRKELQVDQIEDLSDSLHAEQSMADGVRADS